MSAGAVLLRAQGLGVGYRSRTLLPAVDLSIEAGHCGFLLGPNGAGKSTLLATLAGAAPPLAGTVELGGRVIGQWPGKARARRLALLPQAEAGTFEGTVLDFVSLGRFPWNSQSGGHDEAVIASELAAFELDQLAACPFEQLSGGERQRARLAQVFVQRADLMLLDEPFTHLDLRHQVALAARLRDHCASGTGAVFAIVHEFGWCIEAADRVAFAFSDGRFESGPASELLEAGRLLSLLGCPFVQAQAGGRRVWLPLA